MPLLQHLGAPCEPVHKPRTEVALGDVVGEAKAYISAPVHASVTGKTARGSVATLPNARHVSVVPIKAADEQPLTERALFDSLYGGDWPLNEYENYDPQRIVDAAKEGGLVGLGGAAFPTYVKLARNEEKPIRRVLVNGCECEPYLTADYRLMLEAPEAVLMGALLAKQATGAQEVTLCLEDNKPLAVEALRASSQGTPVQISILKTKYPQGGEKQLIYALTGQEVPTGGLPLDIGIVVINVGTAAALAGATIRGKPLTHRVVTVTGAGIRQPKNLLVPIGASYRDVIDYCGGVTDDAARILSGGPMMGFAIGNLDTPVTKGTSGVTVLTREEIKRSQETNCVRCGRCVDVCPLNLVPTKIALAARAGDAELAERYYAAACMECGCCAYMCPAGIPLVQLIRAGKILVRVRVGLT